MQLLLLTLDSMALEKPLGRNELRVLGGLDAEYHKYPYIVRLELQFTVEGRAVATHLCSCSALTHTWTLTAAHCFDDLAPGYELVVRFGSRRPQDANAVAARVLKYILHPFYKRIKPTSSDTHYILENDVSMFKTDPILLPVYGKISSVDYMSLIGQKATAAGYGNTNGTSNNGDMEFKTTLILNKPLQILEVTMARCINDGPIKEIINPSICLLRKCGQSVSICAGDSGGPLLHESGIVGVNSLAVITDCALIPDHMRSNTIGIVTAISPFIEWIEEVIKEQ